MLNMRKNLLILISFLSPLFLPPATQPRDGNDKTGQHVAARQRAGLISINFPFANSYRLPSSGIRSRSSPVISVGVATMSHLYPQV